MLSRSIFSEVRPVALAGVLVLVAVHALLKVTFFSSAFLRYFADPLYDLSDGIVTHAASAGLIETAVLLGLFTAVLRIRPSDLGLQRSRLLNAMLVTLFVWSLAQTVSVVAGRIDGGFLNFGFSWNPLNPVVWAGLLDAHAGGAFIEEVIYRGFLVPQVYFIVRRMTKFTATRSMVAATVASQLYFAANHVPAAIRTSAPAGEIMLYLIQVFFVGVFFVAIYVRTENLFVAIGIHALLNFPGALFVSRLDPFFIVLCLSCAILVAWPYLNRSMSDVFTMRPAAGRPIAARQTA